MLKTAYVWEQYVVWVRKCHLEESAILFQSQKIDTYLSKQIQNNKASRMFACHHSLNLNELINSSVEQTKRIHKLYCYL